MERYYSTIKEKLIACSVDPLAVERCFKQMDAVEMEAMERRMVSLGYKFHPEEELLVNYYLREKCRDETVSFYRINNEIDVYKKHPRDLMGDTIVGGDNPCYFFTRSCWNETQPRLDVQGHWIFGEQTDIFYEGIQVGVKLTLQYCEFDRQTEYKMTEYKLNSTAVDNSMDDDDDNMLLPMDVDTFFLCNLYRDTLAAADECPEVSSKGKEKA
ncbi:hypothetical protein EZV62_026066 [Acer yangbiense]|uniref:NAC domain-containing protein n=1 Tax=Acer yangbiense TaxID=1000413 RepID=A0A5C7GR29_9ROSI|nr:hypothetical protein EZV62_026066 [Acer yangbiense]